MDRKFHKGPADGSGASPPSAAWLFAQALLDRPVPSPFRAEADARARREHLEWLAQISPEDARRVRGQLSEETDAKARRKHLEWLAAISPEHEIKLRSVLRAEAESRETREHWEWLADVSTVQEGTWDPSKHPKGAFPQNRGWWSPTGASRGAENQASTHTNSNDVPRSPFLTASAKEPKQATPRGDSAASPAPVGAPIKGPQKKPPASNVIDLRGRFAVFTSRLFVGGYLGNGDSVITQESGTLQLRSNNLEVANDFDFEMAKSVLRQLGFDLPQTENGIYYGKLPIGVSEGYTIRLKGLAGDRIHLSFVDVSYKGSGKLRDASFEQFLIALWHEIKGHNVDDHDDGPEFIKKYEAPVEQAIKRAKQNGTWRGILDKAAAEYDPANTIHIPPYEMDHRARLY